MFYLFGSKVREDVGTLYGMNNHFYQWAEDVLPQRRRDAAMSV
jgi:hypothetical protein